MSDIMAVTFSFGAGLLLGAMFYGGLWWTVRKGLTSQYAGWWFSVSLWLRFGMAVSGFYLVAQGDWKRLLICLAGFLVARVAVILLTKDPHNAT